MSGTAEKVQSGVLPFLSALWREGDVRELRIPKADGYRTASGYFDSPEALARAAERYDGRVNIYVTVNPVDPALLARAHNRVISGLRDATADVDVTRRRWLLLDVDSVRPSGISATEEEVAEARALLCSVSSDLAGRGWPDPMVCFSGNGYYALYPVDLPNTPEAKTLVERVLRALSATHSTATAVIDTTVANASRILGLVGTKKVKGEDMPDRPHRYSELLSIPDDMVPVSEEQLTALLEELTPAAPEPTKPSRSDVTPTPLTEMLDRAGLDYREQPADANGVTWYHLRRCPFHDDGRDYECGVGQKLPDGPLAGHCFHPEGEGKGWQDFKQALGLGASTGSSTAHHQAMVGPKTAAPSPTFFPRTDAGNAELLAHLHGEQVRYDHRRGQWLVWDGHHFRADADGEVHRLALATVRHRYRQAELIEDTRERRSEAGFAIASENRTRLEALLGLARSLPPMADAGESWDQDALLLGVANGVVDLRNGRLRAGRPEDGITQFTDVPFDPAASCPRWRQFLSEVFNDDEDLIDYVWRVVGYCLTGDISDQSLFLCFGQGANGKSVFLSVLRGLLGRYAYNAPFATFELASRSGIGNDVAALSGKRLVTASETNEGTRLNEARIKALTGSDPATARFLYADLFTFQPCAKYFLAVNHLPVVDDLSFGFWRRLRLLPFLRTFTRDADPRLEEKLRAELPGILSWAVAGCLAWQERGLTPPQQVLAATASYRETSDPLADFVTSCLVTEEAREVGGGDAFRAYQEFARAQGMSEREMLSLTAFGRKMGDRFASKMRNPPQTDHPKRSMPIRQNAACRSTKTLMPISKNALMPIGCGPAGVIDDRHGRFSSRVT